MAGDALCHATTYGRSDKVTGEATKRLARPTLRQRESHDLHEPKCVRRGRESRAEPVVEGDGRSMFRGLHGLTEVDQHGAVLEILRVRQGEIMGRHRPNSVLIQEVM